MAVVILGGLATSTLLNLFVVPLYLRFGRSPKYEERVANEIPRRGAAHVHVPA